MTKAQILAKLAIIDKQGYNGILLKASKTNLANLHTIGLTDWMCGTKTGYKGCFILLPVGIEEDWEYSIVAKHIEYTDLVITNRFQINSI